MIVVYATNKNGDGFVQKVGEYKSIDDIEIKVGIFADDVILNFGEEGDHECAGEDLDIMRSLKKH